MGDLQTALDTIRGKLPACQKFRDYYDGLHTMTFASDKFKSTFGQTLQNMRDNLCPIVVDAPVDRMEVLNFAGDNEEKQSAVADEAWKLWQRESLELVSSEVHSEALKTGYGYLIVWKGDDGLAKFYPQDSRQCAVIEDEGTGRVLFAAKQWMTSDKKIRVTLYYADRVEKYISHKKFDGSVHDEMKETAFMRFNDAEEGPAENPYGVVPMFRFETPPVLNDAIPIQDALNKTVCDKLVAMEFQAFRQRWITGVDVPTDPGTGQPISPFKHGADRMFISPDEKTKFGEFGVVDLEQFLKVADSYRLEMARVSGTPLHFFSINTSDAISGEALKTLESRFTKKVRRLCLNFGQVWAEVMKFALQIEGAPSADNITVQWQSPEQRSEKEHLETLLLKADLGIPKETLWEEAGYTDEDIAKFNEAEPEEDDGIDPAVKAMAVIGNGGTKAK